MSRGKKEHDQQSGHYYALVESSECAEEGAQEGLETAIWEDTGDAEVFSQEGLLAGQSTWLFLRRFLCFLYKKEVHNNSNVSTVQQCNLINSIKVDAGAFCTRLGLQQSILDGQRRCSDLQC